MKTIKQIQTKLVELEYILEKLRKEEFDGYANNKKEIKTIEIQISTLEWVLNF